MRRKSYAIQEFMFGDWIERWDNFSSLRAARRFACMMDGRCRGRLRDCSHSADACMISPEA